MAEALATKIIFCFDYLTKIIQFMELINYEKTKSSLL